MSVLYLLLMRVFPSNGPEIPQLWMFVLLFTIDCQLTWFFWPF